MESKTSFFEKLFYASLGLVISTKEALDNTIDTLVQSNFKTVEEGKKIAEDINAGLKNTKQKIYENIQEILEKENKNYVQKQEVEQIKQKLEKLEEKIDSLIEKNA